MRLILAVTIPALMLFSPGWPAQAAPEQDLPRGLHDPDALTCNAPQLVPVAEAVGWRICLQNSMVAQISESGGLNLDGKLVKSASDLPMFRQEPTGEGDPTAVACRGREDTGTRTPGPILCAHNAFWAKLHVRGCVVAPNGWSILRPDTSKNLDPLGCTNIPGRNGKLPRIFF